MSTATGPGLPPPDPRRATTVADFVSYLRATKVWAGDPSIRELTRRINAERHRGRRSPAAVTSTVGYCFDVRRQRLDYDLVFEVLRAMGVAGEPLRRWRHAWQAVFAGTEPATTEPGVAPMPLDALPEDVPWFIGRHAELDELLRPPAGPGAVSVVEGMAGVGKTALAVSAAHRLSRPGLLRLSVDLRGFDPAQPAAEPADVLDAFLRVLGVRGGRTPRGLDARARLYRALLSQRPALVLLDNAASADQVRPLLPGGPRNRVLITSRHTLAELAGAHRLTLDVFTPEEALLLLRALVGDERVDAEARHAREIASLSGHLPLALSLIGRHIRHTPDWLLADHVERLRALGLTDGVQAALTLSYRQLDHRHRQMFRLIGVNPGPDLTVSAAAALADIEPEEAHRRLDLLVAEHLMFSGAQGRYHTHDLVRAYATQRAHDEEPASRRRQAMARLLDHYLHAAAAAMDAAHPAERHRRPHIEGHSRWTRPPANPVAAREWLDDERPNLIAAIAHAATHGWPRYAGQLTAIIWRHLDTSGRYGDVLTIHRHARSAARQLGDPADEALVWHNLGTVHWRLGRNIEAVVHFERALTLRRRTGDRCAQAQTLNNLAVVEHALGRHDEAIDRYRAALTLFREAGEELGEAGTLSNLGVILEHLGRLDEAADHQHRALALFRRVGCTVGEANALANIGVVLRRQGFAAAAAAHQRRALQIFRAIGDRSGEAGGLINLGDIQQLLRRHDRAAALYRRALTIARTLGDAGLEAEALNSYAITLRATDQLDAALHHHAAALALAWQLHDGVQATRALDGLAQAADADGRHDLADRLRRRARTTRPHSPG